MRIRKAVKCILKLQAIFTEKALISLRAQRTGQAIDLLESCLPSCPCDERELLEKQLAVARKELVRWN